MESIAESSVEDLRYIGFRPWLELPVRPWLALAVVMSLVTVLLAANRYGGIVRERRLIKSGTPVTATVKAIGTASERQASRDEPRRVLLTYTDPARGREIEAEGILPRAERSMVRVGQTLPVKIDPADPALWTARAEPPPLSAEMAVPVLLVPVAGVCWLLALLRSRDVSRVARAGTRQRAMVASVRQSPLAPMSKQIGVVLDGSDRRVRPLYWPSRFGAIHVNDTLDVLTTHTGPLLAARTYQAPPNR